MSPERRVERDIVEAAIHFLFLLTSRLEQTFNLSNPDLLANFKLACRNYAKETTRSRAASVALMEECQAIEARNLGRQSRPQRNPDMLDEEGPNGDEDHHVQDAVFLRQAVRNTNINRNVPSNGSPRSALYVRHAHFVFTP